LIYFYDRNGSNIRIQKPGEVHMAYDALNRMTEWQQTDSGAPKARSTFTEEQNGIGRGQV